MLLYVNGVTVPFFLLLGSAAGHKTEETNIGTGSVADPLSAAAISFPECRCQDGFVRQRILLGEADSLGVESPRGGRLVRSMLEINMIPGEMRGITASLPIFQLYEETLQVANNPIQNCTVRRARRAQRVPLGATASQFTASAPTVMQRSIKACRAASKTAMPHISGMSVPFYFLS
jgi:hypothetical protein